MFKKQLPFAPQKNLVKLFIEIYNRNRLFQTLYSENFYNMQEYEQGEVETAVKQLTDFYEK